MQTVEREISGILYQAMQDPASFDDADALYSEMLTATEGTVSSVAKENGVSVEEVWSDWLEQNSEPDLSAEVVCLVNYKGEDEGGLALKSNHPKLRVFRGKYSYE